MAAWSALGTEKEKGERFSLGHDRLSGAGGGSEISYFPSEARAFFFFSIFLHRLRLTNEITWLSSISVTFTSWMANITI